MGSLGDNISKAYLVNGLLKLTLPSSSFQNIEEQFFVELSFVRLPSWADQYSVAVSAVFLNGEA